MTNWYKAQSTEKPEEYDLKSSPTTVYQRKEIEQVAVEHTDGEGTSLIWEYMERQLTREEYDAFQAELESPATQMIMQTLSAIELAQEMLMM